MILPEVMVYAKRTLAMFIGGRSSLHGMAGVSGCDTTGPIFVGTE
jgi:hypothetical protein